MGTQYLVDSMKLIVASLATIVLAGSGKDPWKQFGGPEHNGWCQAVTDEEAYQHECAITIHVRQNGRTAAISAKDDKYNQFMPSNVLDWNLQDHTEANKQEAAEFAEHVYRHGNCEGKKQFFCVGSTEKDGQSVFDSFRKGCTWARMQMGDQTGHDSCFLDNLDALVSNNRCNNYFFMGNYAKWEAECWLF